MPTHHLDVPALLTALDTVRDREGLTWGQVAQATGLSAPTFTRMKEGRSVSADALCSLLYWLNAPLARFTRDGDSGE